MSTHRILPTRVLARAAGALLLLGAVFPLLAPGTVLAHERRQVGPYTFVVGWAGEPSYVNQMNGATVRITKTDGGTPVEGADKTLKAAVAFGGGTPKEFPLRAVFGQPGLYQADLMPSRSGSYIFTFSGMVEGMAVNEKFESGPGRFDDIKDLAPLQFPEVAPAQAGQTAGSARPAQPAADVPESVTAGDLAQARAFGIAGTILGLIGLAVGAAALLAARRSTPQVPSRPVGASAARP